MTRKSISIFLTVMSTVLLFTCGQKGNQKSAVSHNKTAKQTGKLIEIDISDTNFLDLGFYVNDTITKDGYKIKYFVKDDSTKYNDIYIQCSKGNLSGTFHGVNLLQYRRYFIPTFIGESKNHIYFWHGCATDCQALLVFPKDTLSLFKQFFHIVDYNIEFEQLLFVTDSTYENENQIFELALVDLHKNKKHKITYNNICDAVYKPACIDTVIFNKNMVSIKTTLRKSIETEQVITQTKNIKL